MTDGVRVLVIVTGGIAAYKTLEVVRRLRDANISLSCILTAGGAKFVTPLSLSALSGERVFQDLFSLTDESDMGHIRLARDADLILVAPATAGFMARAAAGLADDLAGAVLLTSDAPVLLAPAMNPHMWAHPATQANLATLQARGARTIGPEVGDTACGEVGLGRMAEPEAIVAQVLSSLEVGSRLGGRHVLVTSGPTQEAIDPVRYISNNSSGKQGHAIAAALARLGARVTLVSGPVSQPDPVGVQVIPVVSGRDMLEACTQALPADAAVCVAAVSDWRPRKARANKIKKQSKNAPPTLELSENPDILAQLSADSERRPALVVGFAAETDNVIDNARKKLAHKGCDWILANDVSSAQGVFGGAHNQVHLLSKTETETWPPMRKEEVAHKLALRIGTALNPAEGAR